MKKLINLIALVMLVSVNVLAPFSYAQDALPEVNPENEVKTVEESLGEAGETSEVSEEIPEANSEEKGELEQGRVGDVAPKNVLPDIQNDVETPTTDETEKIDTESDEVVQSLEEASENEIKDGNLEGAEIEEDLLLQKAEDVIVMQVEPGTTATLLPGQQFNSVIKTLANGGIYVAYTGVDNNIQSFQRVDVEPAGVTTGEISVAGSEYPVHAWFSGGVLYYATKAETIQLNENSQNMFQSFGALTELDLSSFDTSDVTNMGSMFRDCENLTGLNLNNWDTSKVTNMSYLFDSCKIENLGLSGWDFRNAIPNGLIKNFYPTNYWYYHFIKKLDLTNAKFTGSMNGAFERMEGLEEIKLDGVDTSGVTDMGSMFKECEKLTNIDVSSFDTSKVTNMSYMFNGDTNLTGLDLSNFDTSNVTNMYYMFGGCNKLEKLNLSGWDFRNISMQFGNYNPISSISSLKNLNVANAKFSGSMYNAFGGLSKLEGINLNGADTSNVTDIRSMFNGDSNLVSLNLSGLDTSNVVNMSSIFYGCSSLTGLDLSNWDTSNLTYMNNAFSSCNNLIYLNMSGWDFSSMNGMKNWINVLNLWQPLEKLDLTNAKFSGDLSYIFDSSKAKKIILDGVNTSNVTNMSYMFNSCNNLTELDLSSFDTSNVTNMGGILNSTNIKEINMSGWNFRKALNISDRIFLGADSLEKINLINAQFSGNMGSFFYGLDKLEEVKGIEDWDTSNVTNMSSMFNSCSSLTGLLDLSNWHTSNVTNMDSMFYGCDGLQELNLSGWDISNVVSSWTNFFGKALTDLSLKKIDVTNMKLSGNISYFFKGLTNLEQIKGLDTWDTSNVTNIGSIFQGCSSLTGLVDLSTWNTSNITNMGAMFQGCNKIEELNLSGWDFRNVSNASLMSMMGLPSTLLKKLNMTNTKYTGNATYAFGGLSNLEELKLDGVNVKGVTNMNVMFNGDSNLTGLDLSSFDISNVTSMGSMFGGCNKLENLNLSGWDFRNVSNASLMSMMGLPSTLLKKLNMTNTKYTGNVTYAFGGLTKLEGLRLDGADTNSVTDMNSMFNGCSGLNELDLSSFNTSKVTNMNQMFYNTPNLKTIYASDKFVTTALSGDTSSKDMFSGTISVVGGNGTKFDPNYIDKTYALIDKVGQTGYFTDKNAITVKFINTLDGTETLATFAKGQKSTPPSVNGYHAVGGYLDEAMTQAIDLNKGVNVYSEIYVKYERNGSSGGGGGGGGGSTKPDTPKEEQKPAESPQSDASSGTNVKEPESNTGNKAEIQTGSQQPLRPTDSSPDSEQTVTPLIGGDGEARGGGTQSYSPEFQQAYKFAHENGITTKDTIQSAQMNGKLTRIAMAKMLSQYAINVLGQTPDTSKTVKFKDVSNKKDADYDNGVTLAYQLGIMGQNMPNNRFRPNDEVSRAEFATALSRLLYQTTDGEYKSTKEYYIPHMSKLYNEGIISNTDPSMAERRGYVMIMLMRSAK